MTATRVFDGHNDVLSKLHGSRPVTPPTPSSTGMMRRSIFPNPLKAALQAAFSPCMSRRWRLIMRRGWRQ